MDLLMNISTAILDPEPDSGGSGAEEARYKINVVMTLALHLLKQWRTRGQKGFCRNYVVIWPVDLISQRSHRFPYVAAFNVAAWSLFNLITGYNPLKFETSIRPIRSLMKLCTCIVLALIFYPIFAAVSSKDIIGYGLGAAYVWMLTVVYILSNYPCENSFEATFHETLSFLPCLLWMIFLCIYFPRRIIKELMKQRKNNSEKHECHKLAFEREYVRRLMNCKDGSSPVPYRISNDRTLKGKISKFIYNSVYTPVDGYRFPVSMLTAVSVSMLLVWQFSVYLLNLYETVIDSVREGIIAAFSDAENDTIAGETAAEFAARHQQASKHLQVALTWWTSMTYAMYISFGIAFLLTCLSLFLTMRNYRNHIFQFYRGNVLDLPSVDSKTPRAVVVSGSKYIGYQFAYSMWGFVVQALLLLLMSVVFVWVIVSVIIFKNYQLFVKIVSYWVPTLAYIYGILITQQLLVHYLFLQKDERGKRVLAIDRLLPFFNFQYFMVFINSALGLISCLIRIIKSTVLGAFTLSRLDLSSLSRTFEKKDNGFNAYVCLLTLENMQTNPILLTFIDLMRESAEAKKLRVVTSGGHAGGQSDVELATSRRKNVVRNRWQSAMTMVNNPYLMYFKKKQMKRLAGENAFAAAENLAKIDMLLSAKKKASAKLANFMNKVKS